MSNNEIFPEAPSNWYSTTLGEYVKKSGGNIQTGPFGSQLHAADYVNDGIPSIMPKNISVDGVNEDDIARVTPEDIERLSKYKVHTGDIIYSRRGDVEKCALITENENGWLCGTGCLRVSLGTSEISPEYIHAYLCHPKVREWIVRHAVGATMPNLNTSILSALPVLIAPKSSRSHITNSWRYLSEKIQLNRHMNQTLEEMAQALFKSWFVDFEPVIENAIKAGNEIPEELQEKAEKIKVHLKEKDSYTKLDPETLAQFPDSFHDSDLGFIPKDWESSNIASMIDINPRTKLSKGTVAKFLDMKSVPTSGYSVTGVIEKEFKSGTKFQQEDVLLARITPCLQNGKTALVDFLDDGEVGFGSTEFIVLRGKENISKEFVYCLCRDDNFRSHCIANMVGTSGRQRVQNDCFEHYFMPIPNKSILKTFEQCCSKMFDKATQNSSEVRTLTELRDALLPKLLAGELRLSEVSL